MANDQSHKFFQWVSICALLLTILYGAGAQAFAQSPGGGQPTPTPNVNSTVTPGDPLVDLVMVAENLIPRLQAAIESPLVQGLENLAFWIAVIVMLISFARLFRENDGASKELFWWCCRLAVIFALFGTGRTLINTGSQIGYDIVNVTTPSTKFLYI
jgi:hypothetical protein